MGIQISRPFKNNKYNRSCGALLHGNLSHKIVRESNDAIDLQNPIIHIL